MQDSRAAFSLLAKPVQRLISERGFTSPTDPQKEVIPPILGGDNVLLIAPTGTGKTEAAILPIFSKFIELAEKPPGVKILYITPLRALNRDLLERLEWWCSGLDVKVAVRHGDTDVKERGNQAKNPPDLLITTPETLQAILLGRIMRKHLKSVMFVIVDEVHEFCENKRGSQLSIALERLRSIIGRDPQLIGLSATIGSPEEVAKFLVGVDRPFKVVWVPVARSMDLKIAYPKPMPEDYELSTKLYTHPEVAARLRIMRKLIEGHKSVLLFTNTRAIAEVLASRFKVWDIGFPLSIHHGSLAKPARITAERGLKNGELRSLVCTSSLELGLDIGNVDLCIQYVSPRQVTRILQRVGRSGHRVGGVAKGVIVTLDSEDTLEAMIISRRAYGEDLEPVDVPEKPFDALTHQIAGLLIPGRRLSFQGILELVRKAYPYRNLTEEELVKVLTYMQSRYPRLAWVSFKDKLVLSPRDKKGMYEYYYGNLSMIPYEKNYLVVNETDDTPVGVLDEAFVSEYGEIGTKFIVRGSAWKILNVYGDRIYVKPVEDPTGAIPSWIGEEIPVPFEVALEVGEIRAFVEEQARGGVEQEEIASVLSEKYPADAEIISRAIDDTFEQVRLGFPVPTDKRITVEDWEDYVVVHACFGSMVNRTLARLIGHLLSESTGFTMGVQQDPYRIVIQTLGKASSADVVPVLDELTGIDVRDVAIEASAKTGLFKRRMIHVARRFGALSRWVDLSSVSIDRLSKSFEGTVIYDEAVKETFDKDLDIDGSLRVLERIREGGIEVVSQRTGDRPTPIARIGLERIGRKSDLIPPEKMKRILIESAKVRLLDGAGTFLCTDCWKYVKTIRIADLPDKPRCPKCRSEKIGMVNSPEWDVERVCRKAKTSLTVKERGVVRRAKETAKLISRYGRIAAVVLAGKNLGTAEAEGILHKERTLSDSLFELVVETERQALKKRFW